MKTIAQKITEQMESEGFRLIGKTSGQPTTRKGSNLDKLFKSLGVTEEQVIWKTGARAGKQKTEGYELLVFAK